MSDIPEIQAIGENFGEMNARVKTAKAMISLAKDAGEETAVWEAELRKLIIKKDKWARALKQRGITIAEG